MSFSSSLVVQTDADIIDAEYCSTANQHDRPKPTKAAAIKSSGDGWSSVSKSGPDVFRQKFVLRGRTQEPREERSVRTE